jgi:hypothetical protein
LFDRLVSHLESQLLSRVDYVVADQLGSINGRFHQHAILAALHLETYPRTRIWAWLRERAGWSRILPFEQGAAFYISRYIGRDANRCDWDLHIANEQGPTKMTAVAGGGVDVVRSADVPRDLFKQCHKTRKR